MTIECWVSSGEKPLRALLASPYPEERKLIEQLLSEVGWSACCVQESEELHQQLSSPEEFSAVIADVEFPELIPTELLEACRGQAIIIVVSSEENQIREMQGLVALSRPISASELSSLLPSSPGFICSTAIDGFEGYTATIGMTSAELAERGKLQLEIAQELQAAGVIDKSMALALELSFQEAVANAHEHGNLELLSEWRELIDEEGVDKFSKMKAERLRDSTYADRRIQIMVKIDDSNLRITILDEGKGFEWQEFCHEADGECLRVHGRGLPIIHRTMDKMEYAEGGRQVTLIKSLS